MGVDTVTDAGVCVGAGEIPSPRFSCSFDCAMPEMGAHTTDIKSISDDSFLHWGNRKGSLHESIELLAKLFLANGE